MQQGEFVRHVHSYTSDYVRFADAKAGFAIAVTGVLLGVVATRSASWQWVPLIEWQPFDVVRYLLFLTFLGSDGLAFLYAIRAITASTRSTLSSLVGFPDVANFGPQPYFDQLSALGTDEREREIAFHITELARIAMRKYSSVNSSLSVIRLAAGAAAAIVLVH